ncbi:UNVERIFIED_CONTAM: hypothetical protein Sradi_2166900 [Sesamum radiatum]|uniref:Gag-pol polyprotein n=1 Tax=Sesamum radiatum TaxID=300843 RepID=A0AAW2T3Q4_SESRA
MAEKDERQPQRLKSDKYCRFHRDRGHTTEECHHLKNEIEKLIQRGYLRQYVNQGQSSQRQAPTDPANKRRQPPDSWSYRRDFGGASRGRLRQRKESPSSSSQGEPMANPHTSPQFDSEQQEEISFSRQDLDPKRNQNNDALVISATLSNFWVKKVLVDSGSSADIIFYDAYAQLGVDNAQLRKVNTPHRVQR